MSTPLIAPMCAADLDEVLAIAVQSFRPPWTRVAFQDELERDVARCVVARDAPDGPIVAYAIWWLVAGEQSLLTIATDPAQRKRGLGRELVSYMLDEGRARGATECFLEVRAGNHAAIALYEKLGFVRFDVRSRYYDDGEDAWVMRAEIAPA